MTVRLVCVLLYRRALLSVAVTAAAGCCRHCKSLLFLLLLVPCHLKDSVSCTFIMIAIVIVVVLAEFTSHLVNVVGRFVVVVALQLTLVRFKMFRM